jgi:hypothetical protein
MDIVFLPVILRLEITDLFIRKTTEFRKTLLISGPRKYYKFTARTDAARFIWNGTSQRGAGKAGREVRDAARDWI